MRSRCIVAYVVVVSTIILLGCDIWKIGPPDSDSFAAISAGGMHTCGLTTDGVAYCWGSGGSGELGTGTISFSSEPIRVSGGHIFTTISAGDNYTCGITTAAKAYCWGSGDTGQLGNGLIQDQLQPMQVSGDLLLASISTGGGHTCGLTINGKAYCWGEANNGQLGNGSIGTETCDVISGILTTGCELQPVPVSSHLVFTSISAGNSHTCAITIQNEAYCWGAGGWGQLGNGLEEVQLEPVPVSGGLRFASISAGGAFSCGVTIEGRAYCWGWGWQGRLGNGEGSPMYSAPEPVPVSGGLVFSSISAGDSHACAVTTDGEAYCWGYGEHGQLGNGMTGRDDCHVFSRVLMACEYKPVKVSGGYTFISISAGFHHTCGVRVDGEGYCWGSGSFGKLGNGSEDNQLVPVRVLLP